MTHCILRSLLFILPVTVAGLLNQNMLCAQELPELQEIRVQSQLDKTTQPSLIWAPQKAKSQPTALLIFLHSWSADYHQKNSKWQYEAVSRGWIYLHPNFRGPNSSPQACGSKYARQDILDSLDYVLKNYQVDRSQIYLAGSSGGGHMAMLMAGHHSEKFSAVSAWVGISNLAHWYQFHTKDGNPTRYAKMIHASLGEAPGQSEIVDRDYKDRSPIFHLHQVGQLPIEINAGVKDGHSGSVPIYHTMRAYNVIAKTNGDRTISEQEMNQLWEQGKLVAPTDSDLAEDKTYSRKIYLRRNTGSARVTIFEGGHESLPHAACLWLARQRRKTNIQLTQ